MKRNQLPAGVKMQKNNMESLTILDIFGDKIVLNDNAGKLRINNIDGDFEVALLFDRKKVEQIRDYLNAFLESCKGDGDNGIH